MVKYLFILIFGACAITVSGQETRWIKSDKFRYSMGDTCKLVLLEGENLIGKYFSASKDSIGMISHRINNQVTDLVQRIDYKRKYHLALPLLTNGTNRIVWDQQRKIVINDPQALSGFLEASGIEQFPSEVATPVTIREHLFNKLIVQVGEELKSSTGDFPLEIEPGVNVSTLKVGDPLTMTLKNRGAAVFGGRIIILNRYNNMTTIQRIYSEKDGTIRFTISSPGTWMVSYSMVEPRRETSVLNVQRFNLVFGIQ